MSDLAVGVTLRADASGFVGQMRAGEQALDRLTDAQKRAANTAGATRAAYQQMGFQLQDAIVQAQMGTSAFVILGQQGGQLAQAFALMAHGVDGAKGKFASFLTFMGGPGGIALTVGISLVGALATSLFSTADASDKAKASSEALTDKIDFQSKSVKELLASIEELDKAQRKQNQTSYEAQQQAIANAKAALQAALATREQAKATWEAWKAEMARSRGINTSAAGDPLQEMHALQSTFDALNARIDLETGALDRGIAAAQRLLRQTQAPAAKADAEARADPAKAATRNYEREELQLRKEFDAGRISLSKYNSELDRLIERRDRAIESARRERSGRKDNSAEKAAREAKRLADFGDRAAEAIARMNDQFNEAPKEVDRARQATAQLDALIKDLGERKPPNWKALIKQAQDLKPLIQDSLQKPIRDMLADQEQEIALGRARLTGRQSEVEALQLTYQLMTMVGAESEDQLATELAKRGITGDQVRKLYENLDIMRAQTREMEKQRAEQQAFLSAIDAVRASLHQTLADLRTRGPKAIGDMFKDLLHIADNLFADVVAEQLFGNLFRDLQDQVTGADKVSKAGEKIARAVDKSATELKKFGDAVEGARNKVNGTVGTGSGPSTAADDIPEIVVEAKRRSPADELKKTFKGGFKEAYEDVFKNMKTQFNDLFRSIFGDKGLFSESLGKVLGTTMANAQIGATVGKGVTDALGIKGSSTGGAIGGAAGGAIGQAIGGPLGQAIGSIAGGILGSVVGGLFKKAKYGTAVVTGQGKDDVAISGNKAAAKQAASGAAGSIQAGLDQIAEAFGGAAIGNYRVSIGTYKDKWRVSTTGYNGKLNFKGDTGPTGKGLTDFGKDGEAQAIAFAIADAIADGAIKGISPAVAKALKSSTDLNDALKEALKVQEVEDLLGGIGALMEKQFRSFELQAKERVRIATDYGFDVVEIEKKNAEDRAKLVDSILADRVGSLQTLLNDLKFGNLFEGSAVDQRNALLVEIAKAKTDAQAGVDGAADKLADLSRRLVELSHDAFGTAGSQYASDRQGAISSAEAVIAAENERVKAAQDAVAATNAKLDQANQLSNEANNLAVTTNDLLAQISAKIAAAGGPESALKSRAVTLADIMRVYA